MYEIRNLLRTTQVRLLIAFFAVVIVGLSVMAVVGSRIWAELLLVVLGVMVGEALAGAITAPPQTRKRAALLLLCAFPAYVVLSILDLIFGFMPGWLSSFFQMLVTLPGTFGWGLVFGLLLIAVMRLMPHFQEWLHGG